MSETRRCAHCGIELPGDAPAGLCPRCLVQAGFESPDESEALDHSADPEAQPTVKSPVGSAASFEPPLPEELARASDFSETSRCAARRPAGEA